MITFLLIIIIVILGLTIYFVYIKPKYDPFKKAGELAGQNKLQDAITEYKRLLYLKPDSVEINYKIAELYSKLGNYDQVIYHLNEILRIDKYTVEIKKIAVLRMLAKTYFYIEDIERSFQTHFEIIKINPEDADAYYQISFIALGQEEFEIAQKYFEKLVAFQDNFESFFGAGICCYQNGKNEDAVRYFKEALAIKTNSDIAILALSFALQRSGRYNEAITYLGKLVQRVAEDDVRYVAKRLLAFLNFQARNNEEGMRLMEDLLNFTRQKNMPNEIKLSLYDMGFASVRNDLLKQAYKYWDQLYQLDNDYEDVKELLNLIKKDINKTSIGDGFETSVYDEIDDWESKAFAANFLWNICGLKSSRIYDIKNIIVTTKVTKEKDRIRPDASASQDSSEDRLIRFCNLDNENFRVIANRLIFKLGLKVDEILHTYRDSDGVDLLAKSPENGEDILIWVRRWKGTNVGEITLRNFAQAINDIKATKGILLSTADLTDAAQKSLSKLSKVSVISPSEINDLLKGLL
jgi:tetratricopeptide (TPR) repeat protein